MTLKVPYSEFELKIRERESKDLDEAVKIAQRYEVFRGTLDGGASSRHRARQVTEGQPHDDTQADFVARLAELEQRLQTVTSSTQLCDSVNEHLPKKKQCDKANNKASTNRAVLQLDPCKQTANAADEQRAVTSQAALQGQEIERLQKEVARLKHVEQLRQIQTTQFSQPPVQQPTRWNAPVGTSQS